MLTLTPQYITNRNGRKTSVVLPMKRLEKMLEELEDIKLYDAIQKADESRISLDDYLANRKKKKHAKA